MASTMKDISRYTGLGLATISKYLNGGRVRPANQLAIDEAIRELHFSINEAARSLKTNRTRTIGIVIPELSNLFVTTIISAAEDILRRNGYAVIVCDCGNDPALEAEAVDFLVHKGAEGIVNMPVGQDGAHLRPALDKGLTIVLIDRMIASLRESADAVMVDNIAASFDATEHLLERGHEQIGIIVGPREIFTSQQRLLGYRQAVLGQGILARDQLVSFSDYTLQGGYESMKALLRDNPGMTAVFATNYEMTLGAIMALGELGVKVPGEMSFIGFDNLQLSQVVRPRLTVIAQPLAAIGEAVAQRLLARLDAGEEHPGVITLKASLQAGETVARR